MSPERTDNPFDECSKDYSRFRPGYPPELHEYLVSSANLTRGSLVLDVGAGTGKASVPFLERGIPVVSAEPSREMALQGLASYPGLRYLRSRAEALPFAGASFDLVSSAQSFHWFRPDDALPEFARVLGNSGFFAVFWNSRDLGGAPVQAFEELVSAFNPEHECGYRRKDWDKVVESTGDFKVIDRAEFRFVMPMTIDDWIGLARSISYVRIIGDVRMVDFEAALRENLSRLDSVDLAYITACWFARRIRAKRIIGG